MEKTALLVDGTKANRNLELSSRNLAGVELMPGNQVHPYHLLRYDRVIFSQPAIEKLQVSLGKSAQRRERKPEAGEGGKKAARMPRRRARHEKAAEVA